MKDTSKAINSFKQAIILDDDYYDAYMQLGLLYGEYNDKRGLDFYDNAIRISPKSEEAYYNRGLLLQNLGQLDDAANDYKKAIAINPEFAPAYYNIGYLNFYKDQVDLALDAFEEAIAINASYTKAIYMRGLCYEAKKDREKARENYLLCLRIDNKFEQAKTALERVQ